MTEMANGMSQSSDTSSSQVAPVISTPVPPQQSADERVFKQTDVDRIVKHAKQDAVDTFRKMQTEQPDYVKQKYGESALPQAQSPSSQDEIRRIAAQEAQRLRDEWTSDAKQKSETEMAQRVVQNFRNKIAAGKEKYQDFDSVVGDIQIARFPNVVGLLADYVDNSHDILYELGKDRIRLANLEQLAQMSPQDAIVQARRISQSIKDNEAASKIRTPNEPLSQMRPSNTGTDNGVMSVKDYRAKYRV